MEELTPEELAEQFANEGMVFEYEGPISVLEISVEDKWAVEAVRLDALADPENPWEAPTLEEALLDELGLDSGLYGELASNRVRIRIERID
jgi:hypothetical protein